MGLLILYLILRCNNNKKIWFVDPWGSGELGFSFAMVRENPGEVRLSLG